jgi:hypothetical protein
MTTINWSNDNYYLKVGMDATGGTNFLTMGTTQLLSVPYALYAKSAGTINNSNDNDTSATNELQALSLKNDTIFLTNGGFVKLPSNTGNGNFTHYIGEVFGGGVIFHLWKDSAGIEHGLIVDKVDLSSSQAWSNVSSTLIGSSAQSSWDGLSNSNAILGQAGHTSSAAALCLNSNNGGQSDWYLPSIDELSILWQNRFNINKSLSSILGSSKMENSSYWSSSEKSSNFVYLFEFEFGIGEANVKLKDAIFYVRAIRAF